MVYDSLYPSVGTYIQKQIAALLHTREPEIKVHMIDMQIQAGTCDCGLFAIAAATALAHGIQPGACLFKQNEMRHHLYKCLEKGTLTPFPLLRKEELAVR